MKFFFALTIVFITSTAWSWQQKIIHDTQTIYAPLSLQTFNKPLHFLIRDSQTLGGSAHHEATHLSIVLDRGLLDSPRLTADGLRMLLCHELGHLFAGAPRRNIPFEWTGIIAEDGLSMMSSEGQADYYASLVCFRKLIEVEESKNDIDWSRVGPRLQFKCEIESGFQGNELINCLRTALAGEDFLKITYDFPISCEQFDDSVTSELIRDSYPNRQCRLDTIIAGAQCEMNFPLALDFYEMDKNSCSQIYAHRPSCWFK